MSAHRKNKRKHKKEIKLLRKEIKRLGNKAEGLSQNVKSQMEKAKNIAQDGAHQVAYQAGKAQETTEECIREKPLASVGGALAVGVLVGLALKKR